MTLRRRDVRRATRWLRRWGPFLLAKLDLPMLTPERREWPRQAWQLTIILPRGRTLMLQWGFPARVAYIVEG